MSFSPNGRQGGLIRPALRGKVLYDVIFGQERARKWPKARGTPKSPKTLEQNEWFRQASWACKYWDGWCQDQCRLAVEGTPLYTRDLMTMIMANRAWAVTTVEGNTIYPMAAVQDVSGSLDIVAQVPGDMLYRGPELWGRIPAADALPGYVLTFGEGDDFPSWQAPGDPGGAAWTPVDQAGAPILSGFTWTHSSNVSQVIITGLDGANEVMVQIFGITKTASQASNVQVSANGGSTWYSTSGDYQNIASGGAAAATSMAMTGNATTGRYGGVVIPYWNKPFPKLGDYFGYADSPNFTHAVALNAIRVFTSGGTNMTAGSILVSKR